MNVRDGVLNFDTDRFTSTEEFQFFRKRVPIAKDDVLLTIVGTIGRVAVVGDVSPLVFQRSVAVIRPKHRVLDSRFLYHVIQSVEFQTQLDRAANKSSQAGVYLGKLNELEIPLPAVPEQRRIAAILDQADALRAKRREALALLDSLTQSIFIEMFGDPISNPKKWPTANIQDVCELIVDCVNRTAPVVDVPTPFKMIRTSNVKTGKVNLSDVRYVTEETFTRWNRRATPRRGDILLTREAPVGEAGILESDEPVFLGQRLMLYRANTNLITPHYLLFSFLSQFLENQFSTHGSGSTVKHLPLPACRSFQVLLPALEAQNEFSLQVQALEKLRAHECDALEQLDALFASLQHRAFRGEL